MIYQKSQHKHTLSCGDVIYLSGSRLYVTGQQVILPAGHFPGADQALCLLIPTFPRVTNYGETQSYCLLAAVKRYSGTQCLCPVAAIKADTKAEQVSGHVQTFWSFTFIDSPTGLPLKENLEECLNLLQDYKGDHLYIIQW